MLLLANAETASAQVDRWDALEKCELSAAGGRLTASALCGTLEVAEDPDQPDGRQIELAWAVLDARGTPVEDPVFFLAGGPGQSARDTAPIMQRALRDINRTRDLIFLDQRGTGGSNALECDFGSEAFLDDPDYAELSDLLRECQQGLDADVRHYTTLDGARDIEALRAHIGAEKINLIGGSYGTRMAQVYLREYPDRVRSVIIDGVVPTRLALGSEHSAKFDQALGLLFDACAADADCSEQFPELPRHFEELKARYAESEVELQVTHPRTGVAEPMTFSDEMLAASLRFLAYSPETQMMIPYLIHEASTTGSPDRLAAQAMMTSEQMTDAIAIGLNFAVGCSEDWPHWPADSDASGTLMGNTFSELYSTVCDWWPADPVPAGFFAPFESDVPILILSGELDPVTPPEYGDEAAEQFANSVHLVSEGRGHITITNPCVSRIATQFVDQGSVEDLDTECMDSIGPEPFFLNLLGPAP